MRGASHVLSASSDAREVPRRLVRLGMTSIVNRSRGQINKN